PLTPATPALYFPANTAEKVGEARMVIRAKRRLSSCIGPRHVVGDTLRFDVEQHRFFYHPASARQVLTTYNEHHLHHSHNPSPNSIKSKHRNKHAARGLEARAGTIHHDKNITPSYMTLNSVQR
ncbi:unnamed protein product, partial [Ectocarpus sp. 12 AP-2014]